MEKIMLLIYLLILVGIVSADNVPMRNITRYSAGDVFTIQGNECGSTRCSEVTQGTAFPAVGIGTCNCQCSPNTPAFREDQRSCVNKIDECPMAIFGQGDAKPQIPLVYLPLKGQIIYPSKEIIFTDAEEAICVVTSAQYLSPTGWVTLRDGADNDVPFSLYRDEGKTFLQWRGSVSLNSRLEGRMVAVHVLCSSQTPARLAASCAPFRVAGAMSNALLDVRSIPFHAGETIPTETSQNQGLSVLESLAIGVCVLMLIFVYAAGIVFYIHYKQRQRRKDKDPEMNRSMDASDKGSMDSRIDMDNIRLKTNPLLNLESMSSDYLHDGVLSDVSERTEDTIDSSPNATLKFQKSNNNVTSAMVHCRRNKPTRPTLRTASPAERLMERLQRRSASPDFERAPHSDLSIVDCSIETNAPMHYALPPENAEPVIRRKLYFNPVFFETEHLKNPPPAAIDFLIKIREVMSIAKEKMTSKRFIPVLYDIPEEESYHTIDLGWDIPCARRGRRFSAISLKRENSRRAVHCGGCPGCDTGNIREQRIALARSSSCKSCTGDDFKQNIVRKWLDEAQSPNRQPVKQVKSIAKVSGTPRVIQPKPVETPNRSAESEPPNIVPKPSPKIERISPLTKSEPIIKNTISEPIRLNVMTNNESTIPIENRITTNSKPNSTVKLDNKVKISPKNSCHATRKVRKKLPPPPPPPINIPIEVIKHEEPEPIPPEVKVKMAAVIKELNRCKREEVAQPVIKEVPKIVIPITAVDTHYFSDDNALKTTSKTKEVLENSTIKMRRFSVACESDLNKKAKPKLKIPVKDSVLSKSWRDVRNADGFYLNKPSNAIDFDHQPHSLPIHDVYVNNSCEPIYDNMPKPGPLTIHVSGSPIEKRRVIEHFDPDTLDRKPKREEKSRVDKILLKSGGSFKYRLNSSNDLERQYSPPNNVFNRKIGSLRQIYEAKTLGIENDKQFRQMERRNSGNNDHLQCIKNLRTPDLIQQTDQDIKPPVPPKNKRGLELPAKYFGATRDSPPGEKRRSPEERERLFSYNKAENLNARRSGRRSNRTRPRRTDLKKLYKTEDSGYLSTDSNESRRRAKYLMQLRPRSVLPEILQNPPPVASKPRSPNIQLESDTDDFESLCDGRSESGGESVETDSVFFGNFDESKKIMAELGFEEPIKIHEQIDSGFVGETSIILSGDSDSEHRSVISIVTGRDGRASAASISTLEDSPYFHTVEC